MPLRITRVYTKTGDDGTTGLASGDRVPKDDLRIEAMGAVDELAARLGIARCELATEKEHFRDGATATRLDQLLEFLGNKLFTLGADVATPIAARHPKMQVLGENDVHLLERYCDAWNENLPPLMDFILPGGSRTAAALHVTRSAARGAERVLVTLAKRDEINPQIVPWINRLSDLVFILARCANVEQLIEEVIWRRDLPEPPSP